MARKTSSIFREIDRLVFLIEKSGLEETDKLKIIKVFLSAKLKLLELLKNAAGKEGAAAPRKQESILQFIRQSGGRVSKPQLLGLGISGRSLRRHLKMLRQGNKIRVEKSGRNLFYLVL